MFGYEDELQYELKLLKESIKNTDVKLFLSKYFYDMKDTDTLTISQIIPLMESFKKQILENK
jgi:hypothetical protein